MLECLVLDRACFGPLLERVAARLSREVTHRKWQLEHLGQFALADLRRGHTLGEGSYGLVAHALHRKTAKRFAVKAVPKSKVTTTLSVRQIVNERALMAAVSHPFLCKLAGSYQTATDLYFVLELIEGGELFDKLEDEGGTFELPAALFYTANTLSALSHLHRLNVVHRDIKTENLMVRAIPTPPQWLHLRLPS